MGFCTGWSFEQDHKPFIIHLHVHVPVLSHAKTLYINIKNFNFKTLIIKEIQISRDKLGEGKWEETTFFLLSDKKRRI